MPFPSVCTIPDRADIFRPESFGRARQLYVARFFIVAHTVPNSIDHPQVASVIGRRVFNPPFEVQDFVLPIAMSHTRRLVPIHKRTSPWIKVAEQSRVSDLNWMLEFAATDKNHVGRRFLVSRNHRVPQQGIPCRGGWMPFPIGITPHDRASVIAIERLAWTREVNVPCRTGGTIARGIDHLQIAAIQVGMIQ